MVDDGFQIEIYLKTSIQYFAEPDIQIRTVSLTGVNEILTLVPEL